MRGKSMSGGVFSWVITRFRRIATIVIASFALFVLAAGFSEANDYTLFESEPVRPMALSKGGQFLYVANIPDGRLEIFELKDAGMSLVGSVAVGLEPVSVSVHEIRGDPAGLVLDQARNRLYVLTRFDNTVSAVDLATHQEIRRVCLYSPEPDSIVDGRRFLYDANLTSSNGEASCSSCHVFGDMDDLPWDLGDSDADVLRNPNPFFDDRVGTDFHPHKGPMTTPSFRGMANAGPMHWRGDRTGGHLNPPQNPLDEDLAFKAFNVAFPGLLGRDEGELSDEQMQAFTDFALQLAYPPNPIRQLNNALRPEEERGRDVYFATPGPDAPGCNTCHTLDRKQGFFGTDGRSSFEGETQEFKIAHLRNIYQKVGMFGSPDYDFIDAGDNGFTGPQVRGSGFAHDGSFDTVLRFLKGTVFRGFDTLFDGDASRRDMEAFMMAFDTGLAPVVGQQVTLTSDNFSDVVDRIQLLLARARTPYATLVHPHGNECDLVVKGVENGQQRGWAYNLDTRLFMSDSVAELDRSAADMQAIAAVDGQTLLATCAPPGSLERLGRRRDCDGVLDADDVCPAAFDPLQGDIDRDGVGDACDNCVWFGNSLQRDTNGDGYGNACDGDLNNNNALDDADFNLFVIDFLSNSKDRDFDGNGVVDDIDFAIFVILWELRLIGPSAIL